jgi:hypothetical protein
MDANEYALKVGPAEQSLGLVLRQAEWMAGKRRARNEAVQASTPPRGTDTSSTTQASAPVVENPITEPVREEAILVIGMTEPEPPVPAPSPMTPEEVSLLAAELGREITEDGEVLDEEPAPASPAAVSAGGTDDELVFQMGDRRWRVRGLTKSAGPGTLRVNLLVSLASGAFHVDTLELYSARQRAAFLKQAAEELGIEERFLKRDLGEVLLKLEEQQEKRQRENTEKKRVELTGEEQREALELLRDPHLLERLLADFERCGVVGEETNKLVGYLAATSRKLDQPLAVIIQSSSAAGKSSLMDAILAMMPEEERVEYSAMTGQSLF